MFTSTKGFLSLEGWTPLLYRKLITGLNSQTVSMLPIKKGIPDRLFTIKAVTFVNLPILQVVYKNPAEVCVLFFFFRCNNYTSFPQQQPNKYLL